jgi:hypothetical protein
MPSDLLRMPIGLIENAYAMRFLIDDDFADHVHFGGVTTERRGAPVRSPTQSVRSWSPTKGGIRDDPQPFLAKTKQRGSLVPLPDPCVLLRMH